MYVHRDVEGYSGQLLFQIKKLLEVIGERKGLLCIGVLLDGRSAQNHAEEVCKDFIVLEIVCRENVVTPEMIPSL